MKNFTVTVIMTLVYLTTIAQTSSKEIGLWQAKLNGSILKAKDLGYTDPKYGNHMIFYIFKGGKAFFVVAENKTKVTQATLPNLLKKQLGGEGTYTLYDNLESMPDEINEKFSLYIPYEEGLKFLEATIQGEPMSFILNPGNRSLKAMNPEANFELIYLGPF
jgi:hypothetical protein